MSEDEEAIRQVLGVFAWVIRTRDVAAYERLKPSLSPEQKTALQQSFRLVGSYKVGMTIESVEVSGHQAIAIVTRRDTLDGQLMPPVRQMVALSRRGDSWRIDTFQDPPAPAAASPPSSVPSPMP
jgi:hypothetical protein